MKQLAPRRVPAFAVALLAAWPMVTVVVSFRAAAVEPVSDRIIQTMAGTGTPESAGDGGPATSAPTSLPAGITSDSARNVYIAEQSSGRVRRVDPSGTITTVAGGGFGGDGGPAIEASLNTPQDVAVDSIGSLYIAERETHRIRKVDSSGIITTVAGTTQGYGGDLGPATAAQLFAPTSVDLDPAGNIYIADTLNHRVRKVDTSGVISTIAGNGDPGPLGDGGPAVVGQLYNPTSVAVDAGNVYVADSFNHRIRKIDSLGIMSTVAGGLRVNASLLGRDPRDLNPAVDDLFDHLAATDPAFSGGGYGGDGGPATDAALNFPEGVDIDGSGNVLIADTGNHRVRKVNTSGVISTVTGSNSQCGYGGDGRPATAARLCYPSAVEIDGAENVLVADTRNQRVRALGVLSLAITDSLDPVPVGGQLTYTLSAANHSQTPATAATVTHILPPDASFISVTPGQGTCGRTEGTVRCELGDIPAATTAKVSVVMTAPLETTMLTTTANLVVAHPDSVVADDAATERTAVAAPTLRLTKAAAPDPAATDQPLTYTLTATNAMATAVTDVVVSDPLPSSVSFSTATPSQGRCSESGGTVTCELGTLEYSASATVSIVVTPDGSGSITNTATVRAAEFPTGTLASATTAVFDPMCGLVIVATTVLTDDIGPCAGVGIVVGADGVTLDLGGHTIFGASGPGDGHQAGIHVPDRTAVTVKNGTVSGFDAGLFLQGGGGSHTITGLTIRDNLGPDTVDSYLGDGIYVENSPAAHIVGNTIVDNGHFDGIGIYGVRSSGATVENNLVQDSRGPSNRFASYGQGIIVNAFVDETDRGKVSSGNRILNNTVTGSHSAGISNSNTTDGLIIGNTVEGNGLHNGNGNGIGIQVGPGAPPATRLLVQDNQVHGNGWSGIHVELLATGNRILDNDAADNNVLHGGDLPASFDLHDDNLECAGNIWVGNTWGSGGYNPACTTTGGNQQPPPARHPIADFDGDGDTDVSVFRPSSGAWFVEGGATTFWGAAGDVSVPADYDGDGDVEAAVFRPSSGAWYVEGGPSKFWGTSSDLPVPADYDGDGEAEIAVFRPSSGAWFVDGGPTVFWGADGDIPVPGDYDGDGEAEIAVFRPLSGAWFVDGGPTVFWGTTGDVPVPGDYDGNGSADIAVFRPSTGAWFVNGGSTVFWGTEGDQALPLPAGVRQALFQNA